MTEQVQFTRHDLEAKIVKHSREDEGFRKEFIADPSGAFGKYLQVPASSLPKIVVHEETPGSWHIVLPAKPANIGELSEEELESVAGGTLPSVVVTASMAVWVTLTGSAVAAIATVDSGW